MDEFTQSESYIIFFSFLPAIYYYGTGKCSVSDAFFRSFIYPSGVMCIPVSYTHLEEGTHQELTCLKGIYYRLVKNQLELGK